MFDSKGSASSFLDLHGLVDKGQMGVFDDGTPYLTSRGIAKLCGVSHQPLSRLIDGWKVLRFFHRGRKLSKLLIENGHLDQNLYVVVKNGPEEIRAFTDKVSLAFVEYYAYEAGKKTNEKWLQIISES
jgi:hypothetical protein